MCSVTETSEVQCDTGLQLVVHQAKDLMQALVPDHVEQTVCTRKS